MPTWLKVVLIVVGVFVLGGAAFGVYLSQYGPAMLADARAAIADGAKFGVGKERPECVDEAVVRVKDARYAEAVKVRLFLTSCLKAAKPVAGFCDDVPAKTDSVKTASWQARLNERYGLKAPYETNVIPAIQVACEGEELWLH
jgi:hypothetical protein